MSRLRIWKRDLWHWWCPCCLDGASVNYFATASRQASAHLARRH